MPATITRYHAIVCPSCHKTGKASDSFIGRNVICSACGNMFTATLASEASLMIARAALNHAILYLQQITVLLSPMQELVREVSGVAPLRYLIRPCYEGYSDRRYKQDSAYRRCVIHQQVY